MPFTHKKKTRSLLVIEDNKGDCRLIQEAMKELATEYVVTFLTHPQAREFLVEKPKVIPSIILIGFDPKHSDLLTFIKNIKGQAPLGIAPLIVMMDSSNQTVTRQLYELRVALVILKPVSFESWLEVMRRILQQNPSY